MNTTIGMTFHNQGLRSYIEVDLCTKCPRQDDKGCCGYYSPVFYPLDLAYLYLNHPQVIEQIFALDHITWLDASVTINSPIDGSGYRCQFHRKTGGCILPQTSRESVCRQFVCIGIDWQQELSLVKWKDFFQALENYEIQLNDLISEELNNRGLSLRHPAKREHFFAALIELYQQATISRPDFMDSVPLQQSVVLQREIFLAEDWVL